jgi:lysozyme family protein
MKKNFDECLKMLLTHEGGYVNDPRDSGGRTNLGMTQAVYEQFLGRAVTEDEMKALTPADVGPVYKANYWDKCRCDDLPSGLDWSVFDWAVNSGTGRSAKALQRVIACKPDGAIGPATLKAVSDFEPMDLIEKMFDARQHFYENLKQFDIYGSGWSRRNKETLEQALDMA